MVTMSKLIIVIAADHRGYALKEWLKKNLISVTGDIVWIDVGAFDDERSDYPVFAQQGCLEFKNSQADYGIFLCGTAVGMAIAANRFDYIYAGVAWNKEVAQRSKEEDNTNVLIIPSDFVTVLQAQEIVMSWIVATFKGGRYAQRQSMINR